MNNDIKVWGWGELAIHDVWMTLTFDPVKGRFHAVISDHEGVSGEHVADTPVNAASVAHYRQKQNRILYDRDHSQRRDLKE